MSFLKIWAQYLLAGAFVFVAVYVTVCFSAMTLYNPFMYEGVRTIMSLVFFSATGFSYLYYRLLKSLEEG